MEFLENLWDEIIGFFTGIFETIGGWFDDIF